MNPARINSKELKNRRKYSFYMTYGLPSDRLGKNSRQLLLYLVFSWHWLRNTWSPGNVWLRLKKNPVKVMKIVENHFVAISNQMLCDHTLTPQLNNQERHSVRFWQKKLIGKCDYGAVRDETVKDRIVWRINNQRLQELMAKEKQVSKHSR